MQVKKQQLEPDMSRLVPSWEGVRQGCILSPCLLNLHVEYIMRNAGLDESQAGRNINNLRYVDGIILNTKKERGTKRASWQRCKSSKKAGLELNIQKTRIMTSSPITSWQQMGKKRKQWQNLFSWAPKSLKTVTAATKLKHLTPVFWPREFHGLYSPWGRRVGHNWATFTIHCSLEEKLRKT